VSVHIDALPDSWQGLDFDSLIKKIRDMCEHNSAIGLLKRIRDKDVSGYVYEILGNH
jgi:hypothetical protein